MYAISDELYHHGVKGQKWGIRRYQNEDGSLTAEGEKRYAGEKGHARKLVDAYKTVKKEARAKGEALTDKEMAFRALKLSKLNDKEAATAVARTNRDAARNAVIYRGVVDGMLGAAQGIGNIMLQKGKMDKDDHRLLTITTGVAGLLNTGLGALDVATLVNSQKELNKVRNSTNEEIMKRRKSVGELKENWYNA